MPETSEKVRVRISVEKRPAYNGVYALGRLFEAGTHETEVTREQLPALERKRALGLTFEELGPAEPTPSAEGAAPTGDAEALRRKEPSALGMQPTASPSRPQPHEGITKHPLQETAAAEALRIGAGATATTTAATPTSPSSSSPSGDATETKPDVHSTHRNEARTTDSRDSDRKKHR